MARFPRIKRLADFDLAATLTVPPATLASLSALPWVTAGERLVLIGDPGTELLFQVITAREERASIAVASNLPFGEWGQVFPDGRLAAAVVDRLTYRAHVLETGTESYRLRASQKARKGGAKKT